MIVFGVPPAALALAGWLAWGGGLHWQDLLVLAITYTLTGVGITVGYHGWLSPAVHSPQLQDPGSIAGGLTGLLWGGAIRILLLHHATFSINSLSHYFGRRPFPTSDQSRNLAWLARLAFGEAWHNNHHAFPTSARHGLGRWQLDPRGWLITSLERCHLAWEVVRMSPTRQQETRIRPR